MNESKIIREFFSTKNKKICLIAEACDNHFGSLDLAKKMIIQSKNAGADVIKFQHHLPDEEMLPKVPKSSNFKISLYSFLKKYALKLKDHEILKNFCKKHKIIYLCTPFSLKAAQELNEIGVDWFKIGSGEMTDTPTIKKIIEFKKPIIISTGMSTFEEIERTYRLFNNKKNKFALMNCTSEYPPDYRDLNLNVIKIMKKKFYKSIIGHSDHTSGIHSSIAAAALGAKFIEKHIYVSKKFSGPDKDVSIDMDQLKELSKSLKDLSLALGEKKYVHEKEKPIRKWAFRSIVTTKNLKKGDTITQDMIWSKRPGTGIPSFKMNKLIGKKIIKNIKKNSLLKKTDFN